MKSNISYLVNYKDLTWIMKTEHTNFLKNKTKVKMCLKGGFLGMPSSPPITMCDIEMSFFPPRRYFTLMYPSLIF